jgi:hypothetical protein
LEAVVEAGVGVASTTAVTVEVGVGVEAEGVEVAGVEVDGVEVSLRSQAASKKSASNSVKTKEYAFIVFSLLIW